LLLDGLGQNNDEIDENRELFKEKLPSIDSDKFGQMDSQDFEP